MCQFPLLTQGSRPYGEESSKHKTLGTGLGPHGFRTAGPTISRHVQSL